MDLVIAALSGVLLVAGAVFNLAAGIGVLRLPDVFTRLHAYGMTDTMGSALTLAGLMVLGGFSLVTVKLLIVWVLLWFTGSVTTHVVARAALLGGVRPVLADAATRAVRNLAEALDEDEGDRSGPRESASGPNERRPDSGGPVTEFVNIILLAFLAITGLALLKIRDLIAVVMLGSVYSFLCAGLFLVLDAPDVAFTEAAMGVGVSSVLMFGALGLVGREERPSQHTRVLPLLVIFLTGGTLAWGIADVPPFGAPDNPVHTHVTPRYLERQPEEIGVDNAVTAVLASYRGYDTLGEITVVFAAGIGVLLLLGPRGRRKGHGEGP